jgi:alpha-L-fucosidase
MDVEGFTPGAGAPPNEVLNEGQEDGAVWLPSETDVSIRPGWFWRESENGSVRSVENLVGLYYTSVGRNSLLLLNVPPDTSGRIDPVDSARLAGFRAALDEIFSTDLAKGAKAAADVDRGRKFKAANMLDEDYDSCWAAPDGITKATLTFTLAGEKTFNRILLQEYIPLGQRVKAFSVEVLLPDGSWKEVASETTIGYKRIILTDRVTTTAVRIRIDESLACPVLNHFGLFLDEITG